MARLENHFGQPPIIPNISKKRKMILKSIGAKEAEAGAPRLIQKDRNKLFDKYFPNGAPEEMQHVFVEGTDMTLSDLVLYPWIKHLQV